MHKGGTLKIKRVKFFCRIGLHMNRQVVAIMAQGHFVVIKSVNVNYLLRRLDPCSTSWSGQTLLRADDNEGVTWIWGIKWNEAFTASEMEHPVIPFDEMQKKNSLRRYLKVRGKYPTELSLKLD